jgi:putative membrane protein
MQQIWLPYCGAAPLPADWLSQWNLDPILLVALAMGLIWMWWTAPHRSAGVWSVAVLAVLLVSPLCALSSALFSVRVLHHVILTSVAAPLIVWALGPRIRLRGHPALWATVHIALFWVWHSPAAYAAALSNDAIFWLMQLSLLISASAFWFSALRSSTPVMIGLLLVMMVQMGLLGALITFANAPLYAPHWLSTQPWGLSPIEDQQLAGLIMWAPASLLYLGGALWAMWRHLGPSRPLAA